MRLKWLAVGALKQEAQVLKVPTIYPIKGMAKMEDQERQGLAAVCLEPFRERLEECLALEPADTIRTLELITEVAENYLDKRCTGAEGPKGRKGRGRVPVIVTKSLV